MTVFINIPSVGESINEVNLAKWLVPNQSFVNMDDVICELESEKATFELNAPVSGLLTYNIKEGTPLEIGALVAQIEPQDILPKETNQNMSTSTSPLSTGTIKKIVVPAVGESINEVTIARWLKNDGDIVKMDEILAEIESDKATFELAAEASGKLNIVIQGGTTVEIGTHVCSIEVYETADSQTVTASSATVDSPASVSDSNYAKGHASPAATKILDEKNIAASQVAGTGKDGRITKSDALQAQPVNETEKKPIQSSSIPTSVPSSDSRVERREKMSQLRKTIAKRLVAVKNETAMLTTFNEVDMKPIMDIRKKYKDIFKEKHDVNLGFMSFFTKAVCMALQEWPAVNARIEGEEIVYHSYCDISIAVSTPRGLVVPVVRNADKLSFDGIEKEINRLALLARDGKLSIPDMTGGTFSITNGGVFGSMMSTPIINPPQSAILGMHNIVERPVVMDGQVVVRPIMYVAMSYDHRIIDGKESVSFLVRVKQLLEDPTRLLLGV